MKIALIVPGGVDRTGEYRVIPALLALISRLSVHHEVHVYALAQEPAPGNWNLAGACIHNIGGRLAAFRAIPEIARENRSAPFHIIHSIWAGWPGFTAIVAAKLLRIPSLVHVAGGELSSLPDIGYGGRLHWYGRAREAIVLRSATVVSAASKPIIQSIARLGISAQRIPLGVDLQAWPPRAPQRREASRPVRLIHIASLNCVKDQSTLLRSLAALAVWNVDFHMDIVGEDTLRGSIQAMARELGVAERTTFHGFLPQRSLRPLVEAADVNVISSRHEAGPLVLLEAATVGVPTVGTAVGHIAEWAPNAASSVPVGDARDLAAAIKRLIDDEALRLQIARGALQRAIAEDADSTARRFLELYTKLAAQQ